MPLPNPNLTWDVLHDLVAQGLACACASGSACNVSQASCVGSGSHRGSGGGVVVASCTCGTHHVCGVAAWLHGGLQPVLLGACAGCVECAKGQVIWPVSMCEVMLTRQCGV